MAIVFTQPANRRSQHRDQLVAFLDEWTCCGSRLWLVRDDEAQPVTTLAALSKRDGLFGREVSS